MEVEYSSRFGARTWRKPKRQNLVANHATNALIVGLPRGGHAEEAGTVPGGLLEFPMSGRGFVELCVILLTARQRDHGQVQCQTGVPATFAIEIVQTL